MIQTSIANPPDHPNDALSELREIASEQGWARIERIAEALLDKATQTILLVATGPGVDTSSWHSYLATRTPTMQVEFGPVEQLAADPAVSWGANKLAIVLGCDRLIHAGLHDAIDEITAGRPPDSWVLIYVGAESLEGEADLEVVERGAKLLSDECHPHLVLTPRVTNPPPDHLADRLTEDSRRIEDWLAPPLFNPAVLANWHLTRLLDQTESEVRAHPHPSAAQDSRPALEAMRRSLTRSRQRLAERLEADFRQLRDQVDRDLDHLGVALRRSLTAELDSVLSRTQARGDVIATLEAAVTDRVHTTVGRFAKDCVLRVESRRRELLEDGQQLLRGIDWDLLEDGSRYPDEILMPLTEASLEISSELTGGTPRGWAATLEAPNEIGAVILAASGGALSAWASTFLGLTPLLIALSSATGALAMGWLHTLRRHGGRKRALTAAIEQQIHPILSRLRHEIRGTIQNLRRQIEAELARRWRDLESQIRKEPSVPHKPVEVEIVRQRLGAIRRYALEFGASPRTIHEEPIRES